MKKFLAIVLAVLMVFSCVTGCAKKDGPTLADAVAYLETLYKDGAKETPVDYDVVAKVLVNNVEFKVTWETDNDKISVKESDKAGFFTVDVPDKTEAEIPYKLKATIKEGLKSETVEFDRVVPIVDNTELVEKPEADVAYKFYLVQGNLEQTLYATAETENDKFIKTTMDPKAGLDFFVEEVEGGFKFYTMISGAKKYLTADVRELEEGKFSKFVYYSDNGSVWYYKSDVRAWFTSINGGEYVVGTYGSYKTISISEASYINKDNSGVTQFPLTLIKKEVAESKKPGGNVKIYETAKEILDAAYALEPGKYLSGGWEYTLTGKIISIDTPYSKQYGNVSVTIVVDGMTDKPIQLFRLKGDGADKLEVGNTVTAKGPIINYAFKDDEGNVTGTKVEMEQPTLVKHNGTGSGAPDTTVKVEFKPVTTPVAGAAYKMFIAQNGIGKLLYLKGTTQDNAGKFIESTTKAKEGIDVYAEKSGSGYKFYATIGGAKKYLKASTEVDGEKISKFLNWESTGSVFTYKKAENAWFTTIDGKEYVIGTYGSYETASLSEATYISAGNTGVSQFPIQLVDKKAAEQAAEVKPEVKPAPVGGSVFTYKSDIKAWVTTINGVEYFVGTYNSFDTFSLSQVSFINKDNTGVTQFPGMFVKASAPTTAITAPATNTAYKLYMNQVVAGKKVYALGKATDDQNKFIATTTKVADAVDVYAEKVTGGYKFYIKNGGEKQYLTAYLSGNSKFIYWAGKNVTPGGSNSGNGGSGTTPNPNPNPVEPSFEAVTTPNTNDVYKIYFAQNKLGTLTYATAELSGGKYIVMNADAKKGLDFKAEKVTGGYKFYTTIGGAKQYLASYLVLEPGKTNKSKYIGYNSTGSVYTYNAEAKAWLTTIEGTEYMIGTYNDFDTMSTSEAKYLFDDATKANQFPAQLVLKSAAENAVIVKPDPTPDPDTPVTQDPAADSTLTIAQAIALGATKAHDTYTTGKYYIEGTIKEVYGNALYGNMYLVDAAGNELTIYGTYNADGSLKYGEITGEKPVAGDTVKLYGVIGQYNGKPQMKNGWIISFTHTGGTTPDPTPDPEPDTPAANEIVLTVDSLGIANGSYTSSTGTVGGVGFEWVEFGNYGNGLQVRTKNGNSTIWNTTAFGAAIKEIRIKFNDAKSTYDNADADNYSFGNAAGTYTYTTKLSTVAGVKEYVITPDAETYTYFKYEHNINYTFYIDSITIVLVGGTTGGETPDPDQPGEGDEPTTLTPAEIVNAAYDLGVDDTLAGGPHTLTGIITSIDTAFNSTYNNITVTIAVENMGSKLIQCFRLAKGATTTDADVQNLAVGDTITVTGTLKNYNGTIEFDAACTLDDVTTASEIIDILYALEHNQVTTEKYALTGVITNIASAWNDQYSNISVDMAIDGDTRTVQAYRIKGKDGDTILDDVKNLAVGDTITIYGALKRYNNTYEFDAGCELVLLDKAPVVGANDTLKTLSIADHATANNWANGTQYTAIAIDENITATVVGGQNSGKYYTDGNQWRLYESDSCQLTIAAAEGMTIKTVKVTYVDYNKGTLTLNGANVASGDTVDVNAGSITFGVSRISGTSYGQARVTEIEVVYAGGNEGGETPDPDQPGEGGGETPDPTPGEGEDEGGEENTPTTLATFELGDNVTAGSKNIDSNSTSLSGSKSYTENGYTLALTGLTKVYDKCYDDLGNSCFKLGSSSAAGQFSFTVPENVTSVTLKVTGYKAKQSTIKVNGTSTTINSANTTTNGQYQDIVVDTTTTKTVSVETVSGGYRVALNTIIFTGTVA